MKRKLSILLIITMIVSMFTLGGCGTEVTPVEDFEYEFDSSINGAVITGYSGESDKVSFPDTIDGYIVKGIGDNAFAGRTVTQINIPDSVTIIGDSAFSGCDKLVEITIGSGVTSISNNVFDNCSNVKKLTYNSNCIPNACHNFALSLEKVVIGDNVTQIIPRAFSGAKKLTSIEIGKNVEKISDYALSNTGLTYIKVPDDIEYIGIGAMYNRGESDDLKITYKYKGKKYDSWVEFSKAFTKATHKD